MVVEDEDDENHHLDEEKQDVEKDKEDGIYSPDDEDDENSFDHNDTMSEDDVLGNHQSNYIEQEALVLVREKIEQVANQRRNKRRTRVQKNA